ncbi:hypothetical protein VTL71DRAFT_1825 [Oculimacula yallundae]|uniref:Uncharacterized protein n=1 Tax=Oculimacula yallundae TaxID=86028 RepID=A0ABR4CBT8_9HELO
MGENWERIVEWDGRTWSSNRIKPMGRSVIVFFLPRKFFLFTLLFSAAATKAGLGWIGGLMVFIFDHQLPQPKGKSRMMQPPPTTVFN